MQNANSNRPRPTAPGRPDQLNIRKKANLLAQSWWKWLVLVLVIFAIIVFVIAAWKIGGPGEVATDFFGLIAPMILQAGLIAFFLYLLVLVLFRPRTYWTAPQDLTLTFNDYKGNPQTLATAREITHLLKGLKNFKTLGGKVNPSLLLQGEPGVGKQYLAQIIASEAGVPFGYCNAASLTGPAWLSQWRIQRLYRQARSKAEQYGACLLFLDNLDSLTQTAGGTELLHELEVFINRSPIDPGLYKSFAGWLGLDPGPNTADRPAIFTVGAATTNLAATGFEQQIVVNKPNTAGRRDILEYYFSQVNHENLPIQRLAEETEDRTPAQLKAIVDEAFTRARLAGQPRVTYLHWRVSRFHQESLSVQSVPALASEDKRLAAYGQAGQLVARLLLLPERPQKITLGQTAESISSGNYSLPITEIKVQIALAGAAAQEVCLGSSALISPADLAQATDLAAQIKASQSLIPAETLKLTQPGEIKTYLSNQFNKIKELLEANIELIHAMAAELLERQELLSDEIVRLIQQFPLHLTPDAEQKRAVTTPRWQTQPARPVAQVPQPQNTQQFAPPPRPQNIQQFAPPPPQLTAANLPQANVAPVVTEYQPFLPVAPATELGEIAAPNPNPPAEPPVGPPVGPPMGPIATSANFVPELNFDLFEPILPATPAPQETPVAESAQAPVQNNEIGAQPELVPPYLAFSNKQPASFTPFAEPDANETSFKPFTASEPVEPAFNLFEPDSVEPAFKLFEPNSVEPSFKPFTAPEPVAPAFNLFEPDSVEPSFKPFAAPAPVESAFKPFPDSSSNELPFNLFSEPDTVEPAFIPFAESTPVEPVAENRAFPDSDLHFDLFAPFPAPKPVEETRSAPAPQPVESAPRESWQPQPVELPRPAQMQPQPVPIPEPARESAPAKEPNDQQDEDDLLPKGW